MDESNLIEFSPRRCAPEQRPVFARKPYEYPRPCSHEKSTFFVDLAANTVSCSDCGSLVEAIQVIRILANRETRRARYENAAAYHRIDAEEKAEKQARKTRKAAYETLFRFRVTPDMYAAEFRRLAEFEELRAEGLSSTKSELRG